MADDITARLRKLGDSLDGDFVDPGAPGEAAKAIEHFRVAAELVHEIYQSVPRGALGASLWERIEKFALSDMDFPA